MNTTLIYRIIAVAIVILAFVLYGLWKSGRYMYRLQKIASQYNNTFKLYILSSEGWEISDEPKRGWYRLYDGFGRAYYIQFDGPIPFKTAVDLLIKGFLSSLERI